MNSSRRTGVRVWASWTPRQGSRRWGAPHAGTHPQDPRGPESCTRGRQGGAFRKQRVRSQQLPPRATRPSHEDSGPDPPQASMTSSPTTSTKPLFPNKVAR